MYAVRTSRAGRASGPLLDMAARIPMLRSEVYPTEARRATCSPTRIGSRSSTPSTEAVTTGRRQ